LAYTFHIPQGKVERSITRYKQHQVEKVILYIVLDDDTILTHTV
jgi:hypothetical protein